MNESARWAVINNRAMRDTSSQRGRNSRKDSDILNSNKKSLSRNERGFSLSIKSIYRFYFSCGSTHKIEFAQQIHNSRGRVPRELYKGRKIVPVGRGFSSRFD